MFRRALTPTALRGIRHASTDSRRQTIQRVVLTGAVALITISGALTGAWLKMDDSPIKQKKKYDQEATIDDRIVMLEDRRAALVNMKMPLDRKLGDLRARMRAKKEAEEQQGDDEQP
ncbi:hypothetical protein VMCG_01748 [Cytospora schulzeri]|uniref:HIG1 domain-containing protein n=1 Tax=Cytospora schulzeri TaxID=448051 RepID=A0A423X3Q3_9PEZI|nr:hypothetical protein VMCG_01748 [Valsa malicola]